MCSMIAPSDRFSVNGQFDVVVGAPDGKNLPGLIDQVSQETEADVRSKRPNQFVQTLVCS